ncbi:MAG: hypothetical protein QM617_10055 [Comamonas sp.]
MTDFFSALVRIAARVALLTLGLVFALSLLCAAAVLGVFWWLRRLWAKATGRPVQAWVFRVDPRAGWNRFSQATRPFSAPRGGPASAAPQPPLSAQPDWRERRPSDVTDVEPK